MEVEADDDAKEAVDDGRARDWLMNGRKESNASGLFVAMKPPATANGCISILVQQEGGVGSEKEGRKDKSSSTCSVEELLSSPYPSPFLLLVCAVASQITGNGIDD